MDRGDFTPRIGEEPLPRSVTDRRPHIDLLDLERCRQWAFPTADVYNGITCIA